MNDLTGPPPVIAGLQRQVEDLVRRVRDLETRNTAQPGATAVEVPAFPYSGADANRLWPSTAATTWTKLYQGWARLEWNTLDAAIMVSRSGDRSGQIRITCNDIPLWTSPAFDAFITIATEVDLRPLLDASGVLAGMLGATAPITIDGIVTAGTSGAVFALPDRLLLTGPRFVR